MGVFAKYEAKAWPFRYAATVHVRQLCGGTPSDPNVAEGFLKTKLGVDNERQIQQMVAELMVDRGLDAEEALKEANELRHLNGFKRDERGLYLEGRCVKAGIKEAANIRWQYARWLVDRNGKVSVQYKAPGKKVDGESTISGKATTSFIPEHISVQEDRIPLGVHEASGINQKFVHTFRGSAIQYEEYVTDVKLSFTVATDCEFSEEQWALLWLTGQEQGLGGSRSQGYGRYEVVQWDRL